MEHITITHYNNSKSSKGKSLKSYVNGASYQKKKKVCFYW